MNKNIVIERIKSIWLTGKEAKIYIACLECGTSPVSYIADLSKINRVTTYDVLEKLMWKWLVSSTNIKWIKHFRAIEPKMLIDKVQKKTSDLKNTLPFLQSLLRVKENHPTVRYFEWIEWIKQAYKETLSANWEIYNYANSKNIRDHWPEYDEEYVKLRKEKKIFLKWFAHNDAEWKWVQKNDHKYFRKTKLLPKGHFQVENEIKIFDNIVLICSYDPSPFAIIIESEAVSNTQKQIFELIWNTI